MTLFLINNIIYYRLLLFTEIMNNSNYDHCLGDKIVLTGTAVVVPDQTALSKVGEAISSVKGMKITILHTTFIK